MVHLVKVRADAERNRAQILAAARDLIALDGSDVTMDALALRAGVAVGTLYRHFPTKKDLVAAIVDETVGVIITLARDAVARSEAGSSPGAEIENLFRVMVEALESDRAVKEAAVSLGVAIATDPLGGQPDASTVQAGAAISSLLTLAQAAGEIRPDITVLDLLMVLKQLPGVDATRQERSRYTDIVLAGIRT